MHRHHQVRQPAVVAIAIELYHTLVGRVVRILTQQPVEYRPQHVIEPEGQQQPGFVARIGVQGHTDEGLQRKQHGQRPEIALAIDVVNSLAVR